MEVKKICSKVCEFFKLIIMICVILATVMIVLTMLKGANIYDVSKVNSSKPLSAAEKLLILESLEKD